MGLMTSSDILDALYGSYQPKMSMEQWYGKSSSNLNPAYGSGYIYATDPVNGIPYAPMSLSEAAASPEYSAQVQNIKDLYSQYEAMPSYRTGKGLLSQVIQNHPETVGVGLGTDTSEAQQIANLIGMDEAGKNLVVYDRYNLGSNNLNTLVDRYKQLNPHMNVTIADEPTGRQYDINRSWMDMTRRSEKEKGWENTWMPYIGQGIKTVAEALLTIVAPPAGAAMVAADVAARSGASGDSLGSSLGKGLASGALTYIGGQLVPSGAGAGPSGGGEILSTLPHELTHASQAASGMFGASTGNLMTNGATSNLLNNPTLQKMAAKAGVNVAKYLSNSLLSNNATGLSDINAIGQATDSATSGATGNYNTSTYSPTESSTGLMASAASNASGLNTSPIASGTATSNPLDIASTMKITPDMKELIKEYLKQYGLVNSAYSADKLTDSLKDFYQYVA